MGGLFVKRNVYSTILQRVNTPDSIPIIVYALSIFPHFGAICKSKREKRSWQHQTFKFIWKRDFRKPVILKVFKVKGIFNKRGRVLFLSFRLDEVE